MATATIGSSLKHLRDLFGGGTAVGFTDTELLARYSEKRDGPAFEALVARHGPMVAATCRAVLRNDHDVEDAFQATFLVLARKSGSVSAGECLGGWLHRVACRAAVRLSIEAKRRQRYESEALGDECPGYKSPHARFRRVLGHSRCDRSSAWLRAPAGRPLRPGGPYLRTGRRATSRHPGDALPSAGQGPETVARSTHPARRDLRSGGRGDRMVTGGSDSGRPASLGSDRGGSGDRRQLRRSWRP